MNKKIIIPVVIIGIIAVAIIIAANNKSSVMEPTAINKDVSNQSTENTASVAPEVSDKETSPKEASVKEFTMTSSVEFVDGKPKPQFSLKEITVNKGDLVRLKITVTSGRHDFKLDEFGIFADTPLNQETVVEFTADKAGEFVYYCNMPWHRANGHWGTLKVNN